MRPDSPVGVLWVLGIAGTVGAVVLRVLAGRLPWWALHGAVVFAGSLVAVLAWRSVTAVGVVSLGPVVISLGLFAAHFFSLPAARAHVLLLSVLTTVGAFAAAPPVPALQWLTAVVSVIGLAEVQ